VVGNLIRSHVRKNKELILGEARFLDGFMQLLMKERNTGSKWSQSEKAQLKRHILRLTSRLPFLFLILLPFGSLLIPVLAEVVDRRKRSRNRPRDVNPGGKGRTDQTGA
jgi:hypothetical protein